MTRIPSLSSTAPSAIGTSVARPYADATTTSASSPTSAEPHRFGDRKHWRYGEIAEDVLLALRLASPAFVTAPGVVLMQRDLMGNSRSWISRHTRPLPHGSYNLDNETAEAARTVWNSLKTRARYQT